MKRRYSQLLCVGGGHLEGDGGAVEESEERVLDPLDLVRPHVVDWGDAAKGEAGEEGAF